MGIKLDKKRKKEKEKGRNMKEKGEKRTMCLRYRRAESAVLCHALSREFCFCQKMEEDVNLKFDGYDEDLNENPFFKYIKTKNKPLFDEVADNRWIVSSLDKFSFDFLSVQSSLFNPV